MVELKGSMEFLIALTDIYTSIASNHTIVDADLIKFKGLVEDSIEYANGNQSKSVHLIIKYLELIKNDNTLSFDGKMQAINDMLQKISSNLYPINVTYYSNKLKVLLLGGEHDYETKLAAYRACKDSCTEDVNALEQVYCRTSLLRFCLRNVSNTADVEEMNNVKLELQEAILKRDAENFNYNLF